MVDVRSGFEFRNGHIPGAIHAPTWKIQLRLAKLPSARGTELVFTCEHGPRDRMAKGLLKTSAIHASLFWTGTWRYGAESVCCLKSSPLP